MDSVFCVLELADHGPEHAWLSSGFKISRVREKWTPLCVVCAAHANRLDIQEFFLPSESTDLLFLKTKVCVLIPKGFEIMDITQCVQSSQPAMVLLVTQKGGRFESVTIPQEDDLRRLGKRPTRSKPLAMFRIREDEFLLCYDGEPLRHMMRLPR